ncbi:hypothetical protein TNCV_1093951 [Trichonephila clavipes]|uniref:Mutator-like transposase domain-containing protein n=1 Tax=Trichonephila clavipes TaxID=2585209 RepID=A0A8X6RF18_TRICX|nr:hypothetical protein TNCV_1093951 [Trichonephila clavipes]
MPDEIFFPLQQQQLEERPPPQPRIEITTVGDLYAYLEAEKMRYVRTKSATTSASMGTIGKGGAAARIFCGLMNLPPPPAKFERHNSLFLNVLKTISEDSMNAAVHEAVIANDNNSNIAVAVDGTWHKKRLFFIERCMC